MIACLRNKQQKQNTQKNLIREHHYLRTTAYPLPILELTHHSYCGDGTEAASRVLSHLGKSTVRIFPNVSVSPATSFLPATGLAKAFLQVREERRGSARSHEPRWRPAFLRRGKGRRGPGKTQAGDARRGQATTGSAWGALGRKTAHGGLGAP